MGKKQIIDGLSGFDPEDLRPLEERCHRMLRLSEGRGASSLDTVAGQSFDEEDEEQYLQQPDALCRSIWTYLNFRGVFEDAESFHFARQFRDYGKLYDAFEVDLDAEQLIDAASVDVGDLARKITEELELRSKKRIGKIVSSAFSPYFRLQTRQ